MVIVDMMVGVIWMCGISIGWMMRLMWKIVGFDHYLNFVDRISFTVNIRVNYFNLDYVLNFNESEDGK